MDKNLKIVVVYGGVSLEREVSLKGGQAAYDALRGYGFTDVTLFDYQNGNLDELLALHPDFAYLVIHGLGGEDGCIQGALELAGIPYSGSGVACSAVSMDKIITKRLYEAMNIPSADYVVVHRRDCTDPELVSRRLIDKLGLPLILKTPSQGSSFGVAMVEREDELIEAMHEVFKLDDKILAEEYLDGLELTLTIIGNEDPILLPEIELIADAPFRSYEVKYSSVLSQRIIPARISEETRAQIHEIALKLYRELDCCGYARIDFIVDREKGPMVLEVNTSPAMTATSAVPASAKAAGISFEELAARFVSYGLQRKYLSDTYKKL